MPKCALGSLGGRGEYIKNWARSLVSTQTSVLRSSPPGPWVGVGVRRRGVVKSLRPVSTYLPSTGKSTFDVHGCVLVTCPRRYSVGTRTVPPSRPSVVPCVSESGPLRRGPNVPDLSLPLPFPNTVHECVGSSCWGPPPWSLRDVKVLIFRVHKELSSTPEAPGLVHSLSPSSTPLRALRCTSVVRP